MTDSKSGSHEKRIYNMKAIILILFCPLIVGMLILADLYFFGKDDMNCKVHVSNNGGYLAVRKTLPQCEFASIDTQESDSNIVVKLTFKKIRTTTPKPSDN